MARSFHIAIRILLTLPILCALSCTKPPTPLIPTDGPLNPEDASLESSPQVVEGGVEQGSLGTATPDRQKQMPYGVVYSFSSGPWSEEDRLQIRNHLASLKDLGINTIIQVFSSKPIENGSEETWLIFLDEADSLEIQVIAFLHPGGKWMGSDFDYATIRGFLDVIGEHPALLAYLGLHEPLEDFTSKQLRSFYSTVKQIAPGVPIAHYMGNMAWFDKNLRFPGRGMTAGICDICITWYYPASRQANAPVFEEDQLLEVLEANRKLIDTRASESQLWFLGQSYTQDSHSRKLRMPSPEEMERIFLLADQVGVDGFLWYPWGHGSYDQVLSDDEMELQRQRVRDIYDQYILGRPTQ